MRIETVIVNGPGEVPAQGDDWHLVTFSRDLNQMLSMHPSLGGVERLDWLLAKVRRRNEAGSLHPFSPVSIFPVSGEPADVEKHLREFIDANRRVIKASRVMFDLRDSDPSAAGEIVEILRKSLREQSGVLPAEIKIVVSSDHPAAHYVKMLDDSRDFLTSIDARTHRIEVRYDFESELEDLFRTGSLDAIVLGAQRHWKSRCFDFFADQLGVSSDELEEMSDRIQSSASPILILVQPRHRESMVKGLILAPSGESTPYFEHGLNRLGHRFTDRPYRDFYYNVSFEAMHLAISRFKSEKLGVANLSPVNGGHADINTCVMEALIHTARGKCQPDLTLRKFMFVGCCNSKDLLKDGFLLGRENSGENRRIEIREQKRGDYISEVNLVW